jgi:hypothetical protein
MFGKSTKSNNLKEQTKMVSWFFDRLSMINRIVHIRPTNDPLEAWIQWLVLPFSSDPLISIYLPSRTTNPNTNPLNITIAVSDALVPRFVANRSERPA